MNTDNNIEILLDSKDNFKGGGRRSAYLLANFPIFVSKIENSFPIYISGRQFSLAEQYGLIALICLPLFFLASAGSTVFWIIGKVT